MLRLLLLSFLHLNSAFLVRFYREILFQEHYFRPNCPTVASLFQNWLEFRYKKTRVRFQTLTHNHSTDHHFPRISVNILLCSTLPSTHYTYVYNLFIITISNTYLCCRFLSLILRTVKSFQKLHEPNDRKHTPHAVRWAALQIMFVPIQLTTHLWFDARQDAFPSHRKNSCLSCHKLYKQHNVITRII